MVGGFGVHVCVCAGGEGMEKRQGSSGGPPRATQKGG